MKTKLHLVHRIGRLELGTLLAIALAAAACSSASGDTNTEAASIPVGFTSEQWNAILELSPATLPPPPSDITNRFADNPAAAAFGQELFYDPSFSGRILDTDNDGGPQSLGSPGQTGKISCAGCHVPKSGFSDTRSFQLQVSLGAGWGHRRAPSLLDVGQAKVIMWDGKHDALYNQVFGPLESVVEMNSSRLYEAEQMYREHKADYEALFGAMPPMTDTTRFPAISATVTGCEPSNPSDPQPTCDGPFHGMPGDKAEFDGMAAADQKAVTTIVVNAGKAIGAFERLLTCGSAPFDAWVHGDANAISASAQRGAALFVGKGECTSCHSGPFMSDQKFHNVGLRAEVVQQFIDDTGDRGAATGIASALADPLSSTGIFSDGNDGRLPKAVTPAMEGAFRTPILRCVSMRPSFMHTGQFRSLDGQAGAIAFFSGGGATSGFPGVNELHEIGLTVDEQTDLIAFLDSLTGPGADIKYQAP